VVLPGEGIMVGHDSILLHRTNHGMLLSKLDSSRSLKIETDTLESQISYITMGGTDKTIADSVWNTYRVVINWDKNLYFEFEGTDSEAILLKRIRIYYPNPATTALGYGIGDPFYKVQKAYQHPNRGIIRRNTFSGFCLDGLGICFHSKIMKVKNKPVATIYALEVY